MKLIHLLIGSALLMTTGPGIARERLSPEAQFAKITAGRAAGKPVDCINQRDIRSSEILRDVGIVYTMNNGTIYLNRPNGGAAFLDEDDILVTKTYSGQLCRIDIVSLLDRNSRFITGSLGLGDFVPYAKPPKTAPNG